VSEPRGPGRPPLQDGEETEQILVRLAASDYDRLATYAEREGILYQGRAAVGRAARALILEGLERSLCSTE